jgi:hypothetical protein
LNLKHHKLRLQRAKRNLNNWTQTSNNQLIQNKRLQQLTRLKKSKL